jgi:hypothetical protein
VHIVIKSVDGDEDQVENNFTSGHCLFDARTP